MSVRNELETVLSIQQGTTEDYQEYLLRLLEEVNAVDDGAFNKLSQESQNWCNEGVLAYNGEHPIPEFPIVQQKVGPERPYKHVVEPEILVEEPIKVEIFELEPEVRIPDELQDAVNKQFESTPDNEEFRKQEDELFSRTDEIIKEQEDRNPHVDLVKKKRGRKKGSKNKPKNIIPDTSAHRTISAPYGSFIDIPVVELPEPSKEEFTVPEGAITEQDTDAIYASIFKTTMDEHLAFAKSVCGISEENSDFPKKLQKPLDLFRTLVCQNYDKPFEEIYKLAENQSIDIKKSTALVCCSNMKATITTLKNLGMLKEA